MNPILNGSPQANILGIQDLSQRPPVYTPEQLPSHLPHIFFYAQKGKGGEAVLGSGDAFLNNFGIDTTNPRSKYYNHASVLASTVRGRGNAIIGQRIVPADAAPPARLLLSLDIVEEDIQQYQRDNLTGKFRRDNTGAKIPIVGSKLPGFKAKWVLNRWNGVTEDEPFGQVTSKVGSLVNAASEQSTLYPIQEWEVSSQGEWGNNIGLRIEAPTTDSTTPTNAALAKLLNAYIYRFQIVNRSSINSTAQPVASNGGDTTLDLMLSENAINPSTGAVLSFDDRFINSYQTLNQPGFMDRYGPYGAAKVYRENLEAILAMIGEAEAPHGLFPELTMDEDSEYLYLVNPFTATDLENVPYYTLEIQGPTDGGLSFGSTSTHWATGGSDGTMNDVAFDLAVRDQLLNYGTNGIDMLDTAMYPQSCIYDTGFKLETKMALMSILPKRRDMWIALSTQDITQPQNNSTDESAVAVTLRTALRAYPESEIFGTGVCRGVVIGHSGYLVDNSYKKLLPLTIEFADRCANYMGAGDGRWRPGMGFDRAPNNLITMFRDVNVTFKSAQVRNNDWDNGLVWAQRYDRVSLFWPAVQTVYDDDTSVLNSPITMMACVELIKIAERVWRQLTGTTNLTEEQFIERSDALIAAACANRFDERFVIIPETFFTADDTQRGYSWSTKINIYANNMRTVGSYTIVSRRMGDLNEAAAA